MYDENGSEGGPRGTFEIYRAEADALFKQGEYRKAIESFSTALELQENNKDCLVCRSKCYLQLGEMENALLDAEQSLADDKNYHKGIYQKAQALYYQGDFELALVFYHRGFMLRPELNEFKQGIQKAQEAIDNSVGSPETVKLTTEGDLTFFTNMDDKKYNRKTKTYGRPMVTNQKKGMGSEKTIKQLLGELYGDRQYLKKLLKETDPDTDMGRTISLLVNQGLSYLDTRSDFWRQQKPMYARRHDRLVQRRKREAPSSKLSPSNYVIKELERIDQAQVDDKYQEALKRSQNCMTTVRNFTEDQLPNKIEVIANLYSCLGNAYLELSMYDKALSNHQIDFDLGEGNDMEEAVSRGLDNMGRVHARSGNFSKAINVWERKIPMSKLPLETTWLYHEIGRCYLELNQFSEAKDFGEKSLIAAEEADDQMWQLQASVLVAQTEAKLGELEDSAATFTRSLELAKLQGDSSAEVAIERAIKEVNAKIAAGDGVVKRKEKQETTAQEDEPDPSQSDQSNNDTSKTTELKGADAEETEKREEHDKGAESKEEPTTEYTVIEDEKQPETDVAVKQEDDEEEENAGGTAREEEE